MPGFEKTINAWLYGLIQNQARQTGDTPPVAFNKYMQAALQKGGCEGWVQVELAIMFESMPYFSHVEREWGIYTNAQKSCDFVVTFDKRDGTPAAECIVELKCESLWHSANLGLATMPHKQWSEVAKDVTKLTGERKPAYHDTPALVLVVAFSPQATAGLDQYFAAQLAQDSELKQVYTARHFGEDYEIAIYAVPVFAA